jgi:hypothetical protein
MEKVNIEILLTDAFPSEGKRLEVSREAIVHSAKELRMNRVLQRIRTEPGFLNELAKLVCMIARVC